MSSEKVIPYGQCSVWFSLVIRPVACEKERATVRLNVSYAGATGLLYPYDWMKVFDGIPSTTVVPEKVNAAQNASTDAQEHGRGLIQLQNQFAKPQPNTAFPAGGCVGTLTHLP
jgi:hypothetical protein